MDTSDQLISSILSAAGAPAVRLDDPFARFRNLDISRFSLSDQGLVQWVVIGTIEAARRRNEGDPVAAGIRDSAALLLAAPGLSAEAKAFIRDHCPYY